MSLKEQKTIENIIRINPLLYGLQSKLEKEQDKVIADLSLPAAKTVNMLMEIDNKRIDLCNLNVLYGFIERGLGERFGLLRECATAGIKCDLYAEALEQIALAGYTAARADDEFAYLFKLLKNGRKKRRPTIPRNDSASYGEFGMKNAE